MYYFLEHPCLNIFITYIPLLNEGLYINIFNEGSVYKTEILIKIRCFMQITSGFYGVRRAGAREELTNYHPWRCDSLLPFSSTSTVIPSPAVVPVSEKVPLSSSLRQVRTPQSSSLLSGKEVPERPLLPLSLLRFCYYLLYFLNQIKLFRMISDFF